MRTREGTAVFGALREEIEGLKAADLYREPRVFEGKADRVVVKGGRELVCLASNNYLGLTADEALMQASSDAALRYGTGSGASRLVSGTMAPHVELERALADFEGTEAALLFGSGFAANLGTITALAGRDDAIYSDGLNHASIIDGARLSKARLEIYAHADASDLERRLSGNSANPGRRRLIVTDGVFSMDGDVAPLPEILQLADAYGAWVIVDDAHASGVIGAGGRGTADHYGVESERLIQLGTLSKAFGGEGGFVAGPSVLVDYLRHRARPFVFSTAPSPATVATALAALRIVRDEPERRLRLRRNSDVLREGLRSLGYSVPGETTPILPVMVGEPGRAVALSEALEEEGVLAPAIRPPTVPSGTSRLRVTAMATHTDEDLDRVLEAFRKARPRGF
ncbi:MAG: 8-amino-7-oxononanoate synthase [Actinomycetota bacterium]|nr:8-amino-7-oxononanoate synthase [Actinomycetota bacterium]